MAGHIQDRWYKTELDAAGKPRRVRTDRYGTGLRYRARYIGPDGTEKSKSFPDGQKRLADQWLAHIEADMSRGQYVDPAASRVTFRQYAEKWLSTQTTDMTTRESVESAIRGHAIPYLGPRPLGSFKPEHIRDWLSELERAVPASSYRRVIYNNVSTVLNAAVDDGHLAKNPCHAQSVRRPAAGAGRVVPWSVERVFAVRAALPERYRAMVDLGGGCGLRQGEIFGLPVDAIGFDSGWLHIANQVKVTKQGLVFAPPKRNKIRDVPLPDRVAHILKQHMEAFPPVEITLPWLRADGPPVTKRLLFTRLDGAGAVRRTDFNDRAWKPALVAAGVIPAPNPGERYQAAREHGMHALRHFYASVLLHAGENIKALSHYLGHNDPGFTLRVYTHLMPSSDARARKAVDGLYEDTPFGPDHENGRTSPMPLSYDVRHPLDVPADTFNDGVAVFHVHGARSGGQWLLGAMTSAKGPMFGEIMTAASTNPGDAIETADAWVRAYCDSHGLTIVKSENLSELYSADQRPYLVLARYFVARTPTTVAEWAGLEE